MSRPTDTPTPAQDAQDAQDAAATASQTPGAQEPHPEPPSPREARKLARKIPSDAEVADRRRRYAKHMPVHPTRQAQVPAPLARLPEFRECAEERAAVLAAEANAREARKAWHDRTDTARREHIAGQRAALLDGSPPPAPLVEEPWPFPQHDLHIFEELHAVVEARELGLLEEHQARWVEVVQAQADEMRQRIAEARAVVDALHAEAQPFEAALAQLQGDRYVDDRIVRPGQPERLSEAEAAEHERIRRARDWNNPRDLRHRGRR